MRAFALLFLFAVVCFPMSPVDSYLDRQLKSWQKRMGLEDWRLTVRVVRQKDLDKNTWGNAEWDPADKTGVISVLDPMDYNLKGGEMRSDMECTIVHELVHIQVSPLIARTEGQQEDVVNTIMTALLNRACPN